MVEAQTNSVELVCFLRTRARHTSSFYDARIRPQHAVSVSVRRARVCLRNACTGPQLGASVGVCTHQKFEIPVKVVGMEAYWNTAIALGPFPVNAFDIKWRVLIVREQRPCFSCKLQQSIASRGWSRWARRRWWRRRRRTGKW